MKLHITYAKRGNHHSDFDAERIVMDGIERIKGTAQELEIVTTNANVVHAARVALKEGKINTDEIFFYFENTQLHHDHKGGFKEHPEDFLEIGINLLLRLL